MNIINSTTPKVLSGFINNVLDIYNKLWMKQELSQGNQ